MSRVFGFHVTSLCVPVRLSWWTVCGSIEFKNRQILKLPKVRISEFQFSKDIQNPSVPFLPPQKSNIHQLFLNFRFFPSPEGQHRRRCAARRATHRHVGHRGSGSDFEVGVSAWVMRCLIKSSSSSMYQSQMGVLEKVARRFLVVALVRCPDGCWLCGSRCKECAVFQHPLP